MSDKTEQATPRRLAKARAEGDSPVSAALSQSVGFLAALSVLSGAASLAAQQASGLLSAALRYPDQPPTAGALVKVVLSLTLPILLLAAAASAAASFAQTGGALSAKKLSPSFDRLNPFTGIQNLFSWQRLVSIARALLAASLVSYFALHQLRAHAADFASAVGQAGAAPLLAAGLAMKVAWFAGSIGLGLG